MLRCLSLIVLRTLAAKDGKRQPMAASTRGCIRDMLTMWACR